MQTVIRTVQIEKARKLNKARTISTSSTLSCLRHLTETRCSLTSCSVSFLTVVLRQSTTSTLNKTGAQVRQLLRYDTYLLIWIVYTVKCL